MSNYVIIQYSFSVIIIVSIPQCLFHLFKKIHNSLAEILVLNGIPRKQHDF